MRAKQVFRTLALLVLLTFVASFGTPIFAQSYSFAVPDLKMQVYVQPDASVRIVYDITFENHGSPIEIIDVGTPHDDYDIDNMRATMNGQVLPVTLSHQPSEDKSTVSRTSLFC